MRCILPCFFPGEIHCVNKVPKEKNGYILPTKAKICWSNSNRRETLHFRSTVRVKMNTNEQKINTQILSLKIIITA